MRRWAPLASAGLVLLALAWWYWSGRAAPLPATSSSHAAVAIDATSGVTPPASRAAPATGVESFEVRLLPDAGIVARADSVRIGVGVVSGEAARAYQAWLDAGAEGAGPSSYAELASVDRWITARAVRGDDGIVRVGPLNLPPADRYELQARGEDALHFYTASFTAQDPPASIRPTVAAGLRVLREPSAGTIVRVLLRRTPTSETASLWQDLMAREAPHLLDAYGEKSLPVELQTLAPLPPGSLDVVLEVDGIEAARQSVELIAGRLVDVRFDALAQEIAHAVSVELQLAFVVRETEEPVERLQVTWHADRGDQIRVSDAAGVVSFDGVDRQRTHRFSLEFPSSGSALPQWPSRKAIEVTLDDVSDSDAARRVVRREIELASLRWLIVRTGPHAIPTHRQGDNPYPIFVLQQEREGQWVDTAADHFISRPEGLAVSVEEAGVMRVMAMQSPWSVLHTLPVDTTVPAPDGQYFADLLPNAGHASEITVMTDEVPMANAPVSLGGPARGLPPLTTPTDGSGRLRLQGVTVPQISVEVPGFQQVLVDVQSGVATVELRRDEDGRVE